ncbi:hypothetical protein HZY83_01490 [Gemella sp. GH3]|uniref:hypothetical protein n=1 Tax=unclassified Gemella TaxID=2624949 RepID=UPI0015CFB414|nr:MULTISPECIES: hypothetical protein [unclassified Gemella]MBF0713364.1 hypothetical protein [Gemella sp. GH3.1]NYS50316.1 hypothetical protein [Gemella sp. GH3]
MRNIDRLLRILVITAIGIVVFVGAVFAILTFTGSDSDSAKKNNTTSSTTTKSNDDNNKDSSKNNKNDNSSSTNKNDSSSSNSSSSKESSNKTNSDSNVESNNSNKNTNSSSNTNKNTNSNNSNSNQNNNDKPKNETGNVDTSGKKLATPIGNTGKLFSSQSEAHEYGRSEIKSRVESTKKYTEYEVRRVDYADGTVAGWTINIYQKDKNTTN